MRSARPERRRGPGVHRGREHLHQRRLWAPKANPRQACLLVEQLLEAFEEGSRLAEGDRKRSYFYFGHAEPLKKLMAVFGMFRDDDSSCERAASGSEWLLRARLRQRHLRSLRPYARLRPQQDLRPEPQAEAQRPLVAGPVLWPARPEAGRDVRAIFRPASNRIGRRASAGLVAHLSVGTTTIILRLAGRSEFCRSLNIDLVARRGHLCWWRRSKWLAHRRQPWSLWPLRLDKIGARSVAASCRRRVAKTLGAARATLSGHCVGAAGRVGCNRICIHSANKWQRRRQNKNATGARLAGRLAFPSSERCSSPQETIGLACRGPVSRPTTTAAEKMLEAIKIGRALAGPDCATAR